MRAKIWKLRSVSQLFNTKKYAQDMEGLYHTIWRNYEAGKPFDHITDTTLAVNGAATE